MTFKIGVPYYWNSYPFTFFLKDYFKKSFKIIKASPYEISILMSQKLLDVALCPVYYLLKNPYFYVLDGLGISARKKTGSVYLFMNSPIEKLKHVFLDQESLSSQFLLKILLKQYFKKEDIHFSTGDLNFLFKNKKKYNAYLLIGNKAIKEATYVKNFYDLLELWVLNFKMPFTFALWASIKKQQEFKEALIKSYKKALISIDEIIAAVPYEDKKFLKKYYTQDLLFTIGNLEKKSIYFFQDLLFEEKWILKKKPIYFF